jgi:hypothetical protein
LTIALDEPDGTEITVEATSTYDTLISGFTTVEVGGTPAAVSSVTVTLPAGTGVETVPGSTFYGPGAAFTAAIAGTGSPSQAVTWSINETGLNSATTVNSAGVLTVAAADHGKTLTIQAASIVDPSKTGNVTITAVAVLPSAYYDTWTWITPNPTSGVDKWIFTAGGGLTWKALLPSSTSTVTFAIDRWTPAANTHPGTQGGYPVGYEVKFKAVSVETTTDTGALSLFGTVFYYIYNNPPLNTTVQITGRFFMNEARASFVTVTSGTYSAYAKQ